MTPPQLKDKRKVIMKIYNVFDKAVEANMVFETREEAQGYIDACDDNDLEINEGLMTKQEFNKLKEFEGWIMTHPPTLKAVPPLGVGGGGQKNTGGDKWNRLI